MVEQKDNLQSNSFCLHIFSLFKSIDVVSYLTRSIALLLWLTTLNLESI